MLRVRLKQSLADRGYRLTRQRAAILEVLAGTREHLTAEEVHRRVRFLCPELNLTTVYRNLNLMARQKIIGRVDFGDGRARFEARSDHHHHLFCLGCGRVIEIPACPVSIDEVFVRQHSFRITEHQFEAYGYCADCDRPGSEGAPV
ncbi:MAG TPA: transcriptional repressor [Peptococcaceae bacterium]|nr:MAG: Ferric uptake regulator, Fur family [Moorella sp. 60_41]HBT47111.1 transcriptional repressor [Peptococcaceae bacterium]